MLSCKVTKDDATQCRRYIVQYISLPFSFFSHSPPVQTVEDIGWSLSIYQHSMKHCSTGKCQEAPDIETAIAFQIDSITERRSLIHSQCSQFVSLQSHNNITLRQEFRNSLECIKPRLTTKAMSSSECCNAPTSVPGHLDTILRKEMALFVMNDTGIFLVKHIASVCSRIWRCVYYEWLAGCLTTDLKV